MIAHFIHSAKVWIFNYVDYDQFISLNSDSSTFGNTEGTVGQRKMVTAVTFFPARPRLDQTAQIRAKYTKFPMMKSCEFLV